MSKYAKAITSWITGQMAWAASVVATDPNHFHVSPALWVAEAGVWAAAALVYFVPNTPPPDPVPPVAQ